MSGEEKLYEQVCKAHDAIADFRAKLLALLPIASGAGILLLLDRAASGPGQQHLSAIGGFGMLVTAGLYLYELRGIQRCNQLIECGKGLEAGLVQNEGGSDTDKFGAFRANPKAVLFGFVGATWAGRLIYPTVIGAWVYVALIGANSRLAGLGGVYCAAAVAVFCMILSAIVDWLQDQQLQVECKDENDKRDDRTTRTVCLVCLCVLFLILFAASVSNLVAMKQVEDPPVPDRPDVLNPS